MGLGRKSKSKSKLSGKIKKQSQSRKIKKPARKKSSRKNKGPSNSKNYKWKIGTCVKTPGGIHYVIVDDLGDAWMMLHSSERYSDYIPKSNEYNKGSNKWTKIEC